MDDTSSTEIQSEAFAWPPRSHDSVLAPVRSAMRQTMTEPSIGAPDMRRSLRDGMRAAERYWLGEQLLPRMALVVDDLREHLSLELLEDLLFGLAQSRLVAELIEIADSV